MDENYFNRVQFCPSGGDHGAYSLSIRWKGRTREVIGQMPAWLVERAALLGQAYQLPMLQQLNDFGVSHVEFKPDECRTLRKEMAFVVSFIPDPRLAELFAQLERAIDRILESPSQATGLAIVRGEAPDWI